MARWSLLRNDRRARAEWDAGLVWFRLRYEASMGPRRAVALLSRPESAGRVALAFAPGPPLACLHLGVPARHAATLEWMARDMAFSVTEERPDASAAEALAPAAELPWERAFYAQIVDGCAFVDGPNASAGYLPEPAGARGHGWQLPAEPPAGVALRPSWNGHLQPEELFDERSPDTGGWPLGRGQDGRLLYASGPVNVYGSAGGVAGWLVPLVVHLLATEPAGLTVLDGAGDLGPALKRKAVVTRQLGRALTYLDVSSTALAGGFNPLAPLPGETAAQTLGRWQRWFGAMDVHPAGLALLEKAQKEGVSDIPTLERWLEQPEQQHRPAAARSLQGALRRLLDDPQLGEWLAWPGQPFAALPAGALIFTCMARSRARRHVLVAAWLAARQLAAARLVLHGLPWPELGDRSLASYGSAVLTNGPLLPAATVVLAASEPRRAALLAGRFLDGDLLWQENLGLLAPGEAIVCRHSRRTGTRWKQRPAAERSGSGEPPGHERTHGWGDR